MEIKWLGHSCFEIKDNKGTVIVTDPFNGDMVGYKMPEVKADVVTVSHGHHDHNYLGNVRGSFTVIDKPCKMLFNGINIQGSECFHDNEKGSLRGKNIAFSFIVDGIRVCHMGDIGETCRDFDLASVEPVDVLLIPVGGKYTVNAAEAKNYVDALSPSYVIPMHYNISGCNFEIDGIDKFLDFFRKEDIIFTHSNKINIEKEDLHKNLTAKILVLDK